ncbi:MAG: hypothetical protein V4532_01635 [Pseudomonadota bacterium]
MTPIDSPPPPSSKRRWLLKSAVVLGAVGAVVGGSVFWNRGISHGRLTEHGQDVFKAVTRAALSHILPTDEASRDAKLEAQMRRLNEMIKSMPPSAQKELSALLGLLVNAPTRLMITGLTSAWSKASVEEVTQALEGMRIHKLPTTMISYHALRDLTCIAFFSNPDNWSLSGYPGPLDI